MSPLPWLDPDYHTCPHLPSLDSNHVLRLGSSQALGPGQALGSNQALRLCSGQALPADLGVPTCSASSGEQAQGRDPAMQGKDPTIQGQDPTVGVVLWSGEEGSGPGPVV